MENKEIAYNPDTELSEEEKKLREENEKRKKSASKKIAILILILLVLVGIVFYLRNRAGKANIFGSWVLMGSITKGGEIPHGDDTENKPKDPQKNEPATVDPVSLEINEKETIKPNKPEGSDTSETSCTGFYEIDLKQPMGIFFKLNMGAPAECSDEVQIKPYAEAYISQNIKKNILVEGYACDLGEDDYNMELSKRRAEYVKNALVSAGVPENRIKIKWYGSTMFGKAGFGSKPRYRRAQISLR